MKPPVTKEEAQAIRDAYENDERFSAFKFCLNMMPLIEKPKVNYITLEEREYFKLLYCKKPTFRTAEEERAYMNTIYRLSREYQSRFSLFSPTVTVYSKENPTPVKGFPVAPPIFMQYRDSEAVSVEAQEKYNKEIRGDLHYQGAPLVQNYKNNQGFHKYFKEIVAPDYNQPEVIQEIANEREETKRRHLLFQLYKKAAAEGKVDMALQKFEDFCKHYNENTQSVSPSTDGTVQAPVPSVPKEEWEEDVDLEVEEHEIL